MIFTYIRLYKATEEFWNEKLFPFIIITAFTLGIIGFIAFFYWLDKVRFIY